MLTFLYSDLGIPADYREMNGFAVHAFKWVNKQGAVKDVKYTWKTQEGVRTLTSQESQHIQGEDPGHATDLYAKIRAGNSPLGICLFRQLNLPIWTNSISIRWTLSRLSLFRLALTRWSHPTFSTRRATTSRPWLANSWTTRETQTSVTTAAQPFNFGGLQRPARNRRLAAQKWGRSSNIRRHGHCADAASFKAFAQSCSGCWKAARRWTSATAWARPRLCSPAAWRNSKVTTR